VEELIRLRLQKVWRPGRGAGIQCEFWWNELQANQVSALRSGFATEKKCETRRHSRTPLLHKSNSMRTPGSDECPSRHYIPFRRQKSTIRKLQHLTHPTSISIMTDALNSIAAFPYNVQACCGLASTSSMIRRIPRISSTFARAAACRA